MHRRQWLAAYEKLVLLSDEYSQRIATCKEIMEVVIGGVYDSQVNWHKETLSEVISAILDIQYSLELKLRLIEAEKAFLARLIDRNRENH